ncbi:2OG-Fe(II) oxygenase [Bradyrhizobium sp. LTSP857]|uniref:2OG-Fe(II) oxygenase n=1 Tax=Bradyrhizobium sp. LTSP857 TaxID=1619231 RepID=UPI00067913C2|nr:2OG-Fe(II) oxygenase [Bradyrhizobium sp. LTSP857]
MSAFETNVQADKATGDYVVCHGIRIDFSEIINEDMLTSAGIKAMRQQFQTNTPFPHLVIDRLFSPQLLELMYAEFDDMKWNDLRVAATAVEIKRGSLPNAKFGPAAQIYFQAIASGRFIDILKQITRIDGLVCDTELYNGGLHEIPNRGHFSVHIDFTHHPVTNLDNRLVLITYLNEGWIEDDGGLLELWDKEANACAKKVVPLIGRTILFYQSALSLHGVSLTKKARGAKPRRSAACYYYSNGREDESEHAGNTEYFQSKNDNFRFKQNVRMFIPPVLVNLVQSFRRAWS